MGLKSQEIFPRFFRKNFSMKLIKIGILFESQIKTQMTCSNKIIFSHFQALAKTKYVQEHRGIISYSLGRVAKNFNNTISVRMIRRQLKISAAANQLIIVNREEDKYYVNPVPDTKFIPIFMVFNPVTKENIQDADSLNSDSLINNKDLSLSKIDLNEQKNSNFPEDTETLNAAGNLILSVLLDKAAFNFRGTGEATVYPYQLKSIADELHICKRTFKNTLRELIRLNIIKAPINADFDNFSSVILKTGFVFTELFFNLYRDLVKVNSSEKCQQIFRKRAHLISKNRIIRTDHSNMKQEQQSDIRQSSKKYMAEQPRTAAADPLSRQYAQASKVSSAIPAVGLARSITAACYGSQNNTCGKNQLPTDRNGVEIFGCHKKVPGNFWSETGLITTEKWKKIVPYM